MNKGQEVRMLQINGNRSKQVVCPAPINKHAHTKQGKIQVVPTCFSQQTALISAPDVFLRLNERKIALNPTTSAVCVPCNLPQLNSGDSSQLPILRIKLFIQSLKAQADHLNMSIVDFISGEESRSVLKRLYVHDKLLTLSLINTRLECYKKAYDDSEMMTPWNDEEGTAQQQDIQAMLKIAKCLEDNDHDASFDHLLHLLKSFEQEEKIVPFEDGYDLALLQIAGIAEHSKLKAIPQNKIDNLSLLLDPANLADTTNYCFVTQHNAEQIEEAVQEICIAEAQKQHENFLQQSAAWLFKNGQLDLEHLTAEENIHHLCETSPEQVQIIFNEYYKEKIRKDNKIQHGLQGYEQSEDKIAFLQMLPTTDAGLKAWIQSTLMCQLVALQEQQLLEEMQNPNKTSKDNQVWLSRLTSFARQAKSVGYTINKKINRKLEVLQLVAMQSYINKGKTTDSSLWLLDETMTVKEIIKYLAGNDSKSMTQCVKALQNYLWLSFGVNSFEKEKQMLQAKDTLIKAQEEHLFTLARAHIDSPDALKNKPKAEFEHYLKGIVALEELRPPASLLNEKFTFSGIVSAIGCHLIRGAEIPVHQRLRDIYLEYQLKQHFNYNFTTEMSTQISAIPGQICSAAAAVADQVKQAAGFIYKTVSGNICLSDICKQSFLIQKGVSNTLLDTLRKQLEDYAELCKHHPQMARVLAGNVAQTIAVIENTVSKKSELYNIFNQFKKRISMEAMASYMTAQFDTAEMDITTLDPQKAESLKRMFALCQFFQWAPEAVTGAAGTVEIMTQATSGSVWGTAWSAFKTAFKMASVTVVKQGVSTLSDEDVRGINTVMMTMEHGPKEASRRLQAMQTSVEFLADHAKGHSVKYSAIKALFRPFTVRFTRLKKSFVLWQEGKGSLLSLCSETIKVTAVVAPIIASVIATPVVASVLGPALIGYTITAGPVLALTFSRLFYQTDPFKDMALLVNKKITSMLEPGMAGIAQRAKNETRLRLQQGGYHAVKKCIAYEKLYTQFWSDFQAKNQGLAKALEDRFEQDAATDTGYQEELKNLQIMTSELRQLDRVLEGSVKRETIIACLPDAIKAQVPADNTQAVYWAISRVQFIRENLFQKLGTTLIPGDDIAVINRFFQFRKKLTMVEFMRQNEAKIDRCLPTMITEADKTVQNAVESLHKHAYLLSGKVAIHRAIMSMAGDTSLSQDRLDCMINRREQFSQRVNNQLRAMKHVYTNA